MSTLRYVPLAVLALGITGAASAADELVLGTFNCEFLLPARVHLKYGLPFELESEDEETWSRPGHRQERYAEAVDAVARYLATLDADILVLTEVGTREEVEPLVARLREHDPSAFCRAGLRGVYAGPGRIGKQRGRQLPDVSRRWTIVTELVAIGNGAGVPPSYTLHAGHEGDRPWPYRRYKNGSPARAQISSASRTV